jgi:hypothetical protein
MTHTQNASDVQCNSQKTQTIGEGKNAAENDVQSCSQLKRGSEPAFPGMDYVSQYGKKNPEGMSIRDYFAAAALNGSLASQCKDSHWVFSNIPDDFENDTGALSGIAKLSYDLADAMLKAREVKL